MTTKYSLVVTSDLCESLRSKLSKRFNITNVSEHENTSKYDAYLFDARGSTIELPHNFKTNPYHLVFALVDEQSSLSADLPSYISNLELVTESELNSNTLSLRIELLKQKKGTRNPSPKSADEFVKENAFEILQTLIKYSTDWIVVKNLDHQFVLASNLFSEAQGMDANDIIGKNDLEIGTSEEMVLGDPENEWLGYWEEDNRVTNSKITQESELLVVHEDTSEKVLEHVTRAPIINSNNEAVGLFVCVTQTFESKDHSTPRRASRRNVDLLPIIQKMDRERTKAEAQTQIARIAVDKKNNFIATSSHDLRQPLHAIGLFIESLDRKLDNSEQKLILSKIKHSSKELNSLLSSILDISKLDAEAVPVNKVHFAITPLLDSIRDEFETKARDKSISLSINSCTAFVHTDSSLLSRILRNLVDNAIKYTDVGSVRLLTEVKGENLFIRISDTGIGVSEEHLDSIFDEYHQIQNSTNNYGQGLGLSIVKRLVKLLELDISLDSRLGSGAHFSLTIPLGDKIKHSRENRSTDQFEDIGSLRLMIIDDDPMVLDSMEKLLSSMDCEAYPATDTTEALSIIQELEKLPELLIVDYQLADGVKGDDAIKQIRATTKKNIPAIVVTGLESENAETRALKTNFKVIQKPVKPEFLTQAIKQAVKDN